MQAKKASNSTMRDLRQWLEKPSTSAGAQLSSSKQDLDWLDNSKDLSSVQLGKAVKPAAETNGSVGGGGGTGGFTSLFNQCTGKRKS